MSNDKSIVGVIDIGTTKIVAMIGQRENEHTFNILGYGVVVSKGVKRGNVVNIINTVESIKKALAIAEQQANVKIKEVYVGIAGQNIKTITNSDIVVRDKVNSIITKEEIDKIIQKQYNIPINHDERIIQVIPKSVYLDDYEITNIEEDLIGSVGKELKMKFNIVVGKEKNIQSIKTCIENLGLELKQIFLEPLASSRAVLYPSEKERGVIMIDIGGGTTDMAVYYKGMITHTAVIPFGGNVITSDIEKNFKLTFEEAEFLKVNYGQAIIEENTNTELVLKSKIEGKDPIVIDLQVLSNVIQARVEEILCFIDHEISLIPEISKNHTIDIVVTGGGSNLKNLNQLIKFKLGRDARIGLPNVYLKKAEKEDFKNPQYSTAIGLMMLSLEDIDEKNTKQEKIPIVKEELPIQEEKQTKFEANTRKVNRWTKVTSIFGDIFKNNDADFEN